MRLSAVNNNLVVQRWFTCKMNDNTLIRFENLRALGKAPGELAAATGLSKQYWSNMLRGKKSFGESAARNLEEKLELPRLFLDEDHGAMSKDTVKANVNVEGCQESPEEVSGGMGENESALCQPIPTSMPDYSPTSFKAAVRLMGSLVGALDETSRDLMRVILNRLVDNPDKADELGERASGLLKTQVPIIKNKDLNKALRGRGRDPVETKPAPLEH